MLDAVHVVLVIDEESGHEAIYVGGDLSFQDTTIYACDIAEACGNQIVTVSLIAVRLPDNSIGYPDHFEKLIPFLVVENQENESA